MNSDTLTTDLGWLSCSGRTLNSEERASLQSSLLVLKHENKFTRVNLWGKIYGNKADYLIAQGFNAGNSDARSKDGKQLLADYFDSHVQMPKRTFRLSTDGVTWVPLPPPGKDVSDRFYEWQTFSREEGQAFVPFTGDPAKKYNFSIQLRVPTPPPPEPGSEADKAAKPEGEDGEEEEQPDEEKAEGEAGEEEEEGEGKSAAKGPKFLTKKKIITEEERLSMTVECIDMDAAVVPRGAFLMNAARQVVVNTSFRGLAAGVATKLSSYYHLRPAVGLAQKPSLHISELDKSVEFLDPLNEDFPEGCWSVQKDALTGQVVLRSLVWPGYFAYHVIQTSQYGSMYFGHGDKNWDLAHMI